MKIGSVWKGLFCVIITLLIVAKLIPGIDANIGKIISVPSVEKASEKDIELEKNDEKREIIKKYNLKERYVLVEPAKRQKEKGMAFIIKSKKRVNGLKLEFHIMRDESALARPFKEQLE